METKTKRHTDAVMTTEKLCERLLRIAISGNISFRAATNPEMIELLSEAWPEIDMPNRKGLKKCLMTLAVHGKSDLKERLLLNQSKISIACDGWKSSNNINFMGTFFPCIVRCVQKRCFSPIARYNTDTSNFCVVSCNRAKTPFLNTSHDTLSSESC
jgi:hypothetical protein